MIAAGQRGWRDVRKPAVDAVEQPAGSQSTALRSVVVMCLLGMFVLLPVQSVALPLNLALADLWSLMLLPISWLYLIRVHQTVRLPYVVAMWFILLGSFIGTLAAPDPLNSLTVILKEVYLYVWFVTLAALFASLDPNYRRRIMLVWSGLVVLHGGLIVAQWLSPDIWRITAAYIGQFGAVDASRQSGLFENANAAAFFQLMGFVPLLLVGPSRKVALILGMFLLSSILATGSLGSTAGFLGGLTIAVIAISIVVGRLGFTVKVFVWLAMAAALLGGLFNFVIRQQPDYLARVEYFYYGRAEGSAEGRFGLWQRGVDLLRSEMPIWGIGPEGFRDVDAAGKQLHNDLLAFSVERGVAGALGLALFGVVAVSKAIRMLLIYKKHPDQVGPAAVIFLAALIAALVQSQTHQIFHDRSLWLVLALQEAMLFGRMAFEGKLEPSAHLLSGPTRHHALGAQRGVTSG